MLMLRRTIAFILLTASASFAQGRSQFVNGAVETKTAAAPLAQEMAMAGSRHRSVWVGYQATTIPQRQDWCRDGARRSRVMLEPSRTTTVLARLEAGALTQIRTVSEGCDIDAGGLPVVWLDGVNGDASASWLTGLLRDGAAPGADRRMREQVLATLAFQDSQVASNTLVDVAKNDRVAEHRSKALFWLSQRAGQIATATISAAVDHDPEVAVRKKAVFALSQLPADQGVLLLIQVARANASPEVRKQAMFWLGQSKDQRAVSFFEEVLRR